MRQAPFILGGGALVAAAAEATRRAYRTSQLFCPSREPLRTWDPADYGIPPGAFEELTIPTEDGVTLHAWYCRATRPVASALFLHGNSGNLTTCAGVIPHLLEAGLSVLIFDYRGYGRSTGKPTLRGVLADARTAAEFHDRIRPPHLPSILYGFSLGGAIGAQLLRQHPFDGLILQSTFTSLQQITRVLYPRMPLHLMAGRLFDTITVVRTLQIPLLVLHGADDELIPFSMARELFEACSSSRRIHCVQQGLHNDIYDRDADTLVWLISQFLSDIPAGRQNLLPSSSHAPAWKDLAARLARKSSRRSGATDTRVSSSRVIASAAPARRRYS